VASGMVLSLMKTLNQVFFDARSGGGAFEISTSVVTASSTVLDLEA